MDEQRGDIKTGPKLLVQTSDTTEMPTIAEAPSSIRGVPKVPIQVNATDEMATLGEPSSMPS